MTKGELNDRYFNWMCQLVCNNQYVKGLSYQKLLRHLHEIEFTYIIPMDANREEDGIDLRYRFGYEHRYSRTVIESYLSDRPCSVFEMLIALSIRCEEHIMSDPDIGDRTGQWFWNMIVNLGLGPMNDIHYNKIFTDKIVSRFLNREYERDGTGGLFVLQKSKKDMRTAEIWNQMCWYLAETDVG